MQSRDEEEKKNKQNKTQNKAKIKTKTHCETNNCSIKCVGIKDWSNARESISCVKKK